MAFGQNCNTLTCSCGSCCLQVVENSPAGTSVGFATIDLTLTGDSEFTIQDDNFVIDGTTGKVTVAENTTLDADVENPCIILIISRGDGISQLFWRWYT